MRAGRWNGARALVGWLVAVVAVAAVAAAGCDSSGGGGSAAVLSCRGYCDAVEAAGCEPPIYTSAKHCKSYECLALESATERCQTASKAYYDCATAQPDLCAEAKCARQLDAARNCGAGGRGGQGGSSGSSGLSGRGGGSSGAGGAGGRGASGGGGPGGRGGTGGVWTPGVLGTRLVLWLDAGTEAGLADGVRLDLWRDRSEFGNHAEQPDPLYRPSFRRVGINGLPVMSFDGSSTYFHVLDTDSLRLGTGNFIVMAVVRALPTGIPNSVIVQKAEAVEPLRGLSLYLNASASTPTNKAAIQVSRQQYATSAGDFLDSTPRLFAGRRRDGLLEIWVNATIHGSVFLGNAVDIGAPGQAFLIGINYFDPTGRFHGFQGDIAEIIVVRGTVDDFELPMLQSYLMTKYGLF
jgi:hypothetical protein